MTADPDRTAGTGGGALVPTRVAAAPVRRNARMLVGVARPVAEVGGLLLLEILSNPRARAAAHGLVRSLGRRLASGTAPGRRLAADRSAIACQVTVVEEPAATSVLVRCIETALAVPPAGRSVDVVPRRRPGA